MTTKIKQPLLATDSVGTDQLINDAVTTAKIADDAVGADQLADGAIGAAAIATNAITTVKIQNDAVTQSKLADDSVGEDQIIDASITTDKVAPGAITQEKLAGSSVGSSQLEDASIMSQHFNEGVVNTTALATGAVVASKVADASITLVKLATGPANSVLVRNDTGTVVNLSPGTNNYVLTMLDGVPTWASQLLPTGVMCDYYGTGAPTGWVNANGTTIGDPSSEATGLADTVAKNLFLFMWNGLPNSIAAVSGGRGASADADWAAHKTITLPDLRGRTTFGYESLQLEESGRITSLTVTGDLAQVGLTGGSEKHVLTIEQMPPHRHFQYVNQFGDGDYPVPDGSIQSVPGYNPYGVAILGWRHLVGVGVYSYGGAVFLENYIEPGYGQTSTAGGADAEATVADAHPQMPPMMLVSKIIKL